jgi:hypothetical protein
MTKKTVLLNGQPVGCLTLISVFKTRQDLKFGVVSVLRQALEQQDYSLFKTR